MPPRAKKSREQQQFEKRRSVVAQIHLDRGWALPTQPFTIESLAQWDKDEKAAQKARDTLTERGEVAPAEDRSHRECMLALCESNDKISSQPSQTYRQRLITKLNEFGVDVEQDRADAQAKAEAKAKRENDRKRQSTSTTEDSESPERPRRRTKIKGFGYAGNTMKKWEKNSDDQQTFWERIWLPPTPDDVEDQDSSLTTEEKSRKSNVANLPPRFRHVGKPGTGKLQFDLQLDKEETSKRMKQFGDRAASIVECLRELSICWSRSKTRSKAHWQPMVRSFWCLLSSASQEFLMECLLSGIDQHVQITLGKNAFTWEELLELPGWDDALCSEKGVYLDVVRKEFFNGGQPLKLYVGSGTGKFGVAQRIWSYLNQDQHKHLKGAHGSAIKEGWKVNMRGLAHYGNNPFPWLCSLAETFFMLYIGTIQDPGRRYAPDQKESKFIDDALYEYVAEIRSIAKLDIPVGFGLNSTWSLTQGYQGIQAGAQCRTCGRKVLPREDPLYEPSMFVPVDSSRPGEEVECRTCITYSRLNDGRARPQHLEDALDFIRNAPIPEFCSNPPCSVRLASLEEHWGHMTFKRPYEVGHSAARPMQDDAYFDGQWTWVCTMCRRNKSRIQSTG